MCFELNFDVFFLFDEILMASIANFFGAIMKLFSILTAQNFAYVFR